MNIYLRPHKAQWPDILRRPEVPQADLERIITEVFRQVAKGGDAALRDYTAQFDGVEIDEMTLSQQARRDAASAVPEELKQAIRVAHYNIAKFHAAQRESPSVIETMEGVSCWRKPVPIERVGLYIPGGTAPLFSTVLMLGIPAKLAGCRELVLCSPPTTNGSIHPAIVYAAEVVGIDKIIQVGGSQAIAALALGTESVPKVYKIFGPGNQYVTAAKQHAQKLGVSIDMPAGPSEVLVVADDTAVPAFVAADLLSQAEHGHDSQVVLLTFSEDVLRQVNAEVEAQLAVLPRRDIAKQALANSKMILMDSADEAVAFINEYAPEHLIIACANEDFYVQKVINAGSVFLGNYTPESAGDYASGTNHTLPTNGYAKAFSGVSLDSFLKKITYQRITEEGLLNLGRTVEVMAAAEELIAHQRAVSIRLDHIAKHIP
jgi:histidinol dehydrogenase